MDSDVITDDGGEPVPLVLTPAQRKALKGLAHHLKPVVMIGDAGLSDSVVAEVDRALKAHELVKIRVLGDERAGRVTYLQELAERLGCAPVQVIGKVLVVWRPAPEEVEYAGTGKKRPKRMIPKKRLEARAEQRSAIRRGGAKLPVTVKARAARRPAAPPAAVPAMAPAKRAALVRLVSPGESAPRAKATRPPKAGRTETPTRAGRAPATGRITRAQTAARISKPESALRPPRAEPQDKPAKFARTARMDDPAPADRPPRRAFPAPAPAGSTARAPAAPTPAPVRRHSPARPATLGKLRPAGSPRKGPGRG